ncbi:MAG: MFS transporter, partial [Candidatus Thorarchaeota archaeon]
FLIVQPVMISITGPIAGLVSEKVNAKAQTTVGLLVQMAGLVFLALVIPNIPFMALGVAIMGTGLSIFSVSNGNFIMTSAPKEYMGVVSALINLARTTGFSVATALATTIFGIFFLMTNPLGLDSGSFFVTGYGQAIQLTIFMFSFLALIAAIISSQRGMNQVEIDRFTDSMGEDDITDQTHQQ